MGRKDRIVKVNDILVDPSESEYQLRQLGGIFASCVVDWIQDDKNNIQIAAFVEVERGSTTGCWTHCVIIRGCRVPRHVSSGSRVSTRIINTSAPQHPDAVRPLSRIPYTNSDKINLKLLQDRLHSVLNPSLLFGINRGDKYDNTSPGGGNPRHSQRLPWKPPFVWSSGRATG